LRLQKQLSRKTEGKEYGKWVVVIPPSKVDELGWKEGVELTTEIEKNKLIIMPTEKKSDLYKKKERK
jgi:antitoxin component of MazEF toxin-antitoxin module